MRSSNPWSGQGAVLGALVAGAVAFAGCPAAADEAAGSQGASSQGVRHVQVTQQALANVPGNSLTAITVELAPGAVSPGHRHAGFVFAYVLSGEIRSQLNDGPARIYRAGESFVEPPGTVHTLSENPSRTEPARLLVVFVAEEGAELTTFSR